MKRADELPARIATLFAPLRGEPARFQIVHGPGEVVVEEAQREGAARVERVVLYTAYRTDELSFDDVVDPVQYRLPIEEEAPNPAVRRDLMWMSSEVALPGWASLFPHVKVQKDEQGHAAIELRVET